MTIRYKTNITSEKGNKKTDQAKSQKKITKNYEKRFDWEIKD